MNMMRHAMKRLIRLCAITAVAAVLLLPMSGCWASRGLMYDDDEWSFHELGVDDNAIINSEIDWDEMDR